MASPAWFKHIARWRGGATRRSAVVAAATVLNVVALTVTPVAAEDPAAAAGRGHFKIGLGICRFAVSYPLRAGEAYARRVVALSDGPVSGFTYLSLLATSPPPGSGRGEAFHTWSKRCEVGRGELQALVDESAAKPATRRLAQIILRMIEAAEEIVAAEHGLCPPTAARAPFRTELAAAAAVKCASVLPDERAPGDEDCGAHLLRWSNCMFNRVVSVPLPKGLWNEALAENGMTLEVQSCDH